MAGVFDPYLILQVRRSATRDEIKRSYRKLVSRFHPDVCDAPDAAHKFRMVVAAYELLDERKKQPVVIRRTHRPRPGGMGVPPRAPRPPKSRTRYSMNLERKMDQLSLQELIARLEGSQNRFVKMAAISALGRRHCLAAVHALSRHASICTEKDVVLSILAALGESRITRAAYTIVPFLSHHDQRISMAAEHALNALKSEVTAPILERLLRTGPLVFRARAVRVLRRVFSFAAA
ncbi:MAG: DnaJ domain-containing protein [bacterium]